MSAPGAGYTVVWGGIALSAATAKTVAGVLAGTNKPVTIAEILVDCDATSGNLLVELIYATADGTRTAFTPLLIRGPSETAEVTAGINYTVEPTSPTIVKKLGRIALPAGPIAIQYPLGREPTGVIASATSGKVVGVRCTASVAVTNCDGHIEFEE